MSSTVNNSFPTRILFKLLPLSVVNTTPVQNQYYTLCDLKNGNYKVYKLVVLQNNTGAANADLNVRLTVDGVVYTCAISGALAATAYLLKLAVDFSVSPQRTLQAVNASTASPILFDPFPLECGNIKIEVEQTSAVGTNPVLWAWVSITSS